MRELVCELLGDKHAVVIEQSADLMLLFRFAVPGLKNLSFFIKDLRDPNVTVGSDITPAAVGKDEETKVAEVFARGHFAHSNWIMIYDCKYNLVMAKNQDHRC